MATELEIAELRLNTQIVADSTYTDEFLGDLIDTYGMTESEHKIWIVKRNQVAALVDVSEGGSSRKMSQVFERYDAIVKGYETDDNGGTGGRRAPRTRAIVRG